ncbi:PD-(D/E)XK nuclease family protein [Mycobacterium scrofulaceum]|uniref:PD-(D/E)XK endonuclease-like domain-containing protein n=1 Tax=Mycobacterium scrofulaceum TaxID=1783 RepID=A0A1A2UDB4_MYCSC|nr:PD-(D/E)XK nuclease family protein [Mycobacterium scrofulaceum]OBH86649.1 hypothetical protein A5679_26905 [Mycobacterium scrofulaceum]
MELSVRKPPYTIPSYSLTGDLLSFMRCGLQYRYGGLGRLPATRPAQMWFGQFIHGVLEEAFRRYRACDDGAIVDDAELADILDLIARRLEASGLRPRNRNLESMGKERAKIAVRRLGPELFPIISQAEIPLNGTRSMPFTRWPKSLPRRESNRYEMAGVVDVITRVQLDEAKYKTNRIVSAITAALQPPLPSEFEVIVDYKGMRRPPTRTRPHAPDFWSIYEWQLQTYAQLRSLQPDAKTVRAGVLVFLNELRPSATDIQELQREIRHGWTDVVPVEGTNDARFLLSAKRGTVPDLSFNFRLQRALRVVAVTDESQEASARHFDNEVLKIEIARAKERMSPHIRAEWPTNATDNATCVACDWRPVCPEHPTAAVMLPIESA